MTTPPPSAIRSGGTALVSTTSTSSDVVAGATLYGMAMPYGQWALVDSPREGTFTEVIEKGAFTRSIAQDRAKLRVIYDHGMDSLLGRRPIGPLASLGEDQRGLFYSVSLLDNLAGRELVPGLRAGLYASSVNMVVTKQSYDPRARRSVHNPGALPERRVLEAKVVEISITPFPVYVTSASVRGVAPSRAVVPSRVVAPTRRRFLSDDEWLDHLKAAAR